jgi:IS605 OrfB family transposase
MNKTVITRKIILKPTGSTEEMNHAYSYIRNGMEIQSQMMNMCISAMYTAKLSHISSDDYKEMLAEYGRVPNSKLKSAYAGLRMEKYPTGLHTASDVLNACKKRFKTACDNGLLYGKISLSTFRQDTPLFVRSEFISVMGTKMKSPGKPRKNGFYHDYKNSDELKTALFNDNNPKIHLCFTNNIKFDVEFGSIRRSHETRSLFDKIFEGNYKICDSSIGINKRNNKKIELNLVLEIPVRQNTLDTSVCVGVDLGMAYPAVGALNNDLYESIFIGSYDELARQRVKIQSERRRIKESLTKTTGGHGRIKKLRHLKTISVSERNYVRTYNHYVSRKIIEFALKNNAAYINLENLQNIGKEEKNSFVLRNWSYYELQSFIIYKAKHNGIAVRFIDPAYTSQRCSVCGQLGKRISQTTFSCNNPLCKSYSIYEKGINADFNAARNISMSESFVKGDDLRLT